MKKQFLTIAMLIITSLSNIVNAQAPNWIWANGAVGGISERGNSISTDSSGNVYVTGSFVSPVLAFGTITLTNAGNVDVFIVKYDSSGSVLWAISFGGVGDDFGHGISTDANGNISVTGQYDSPSLTFGTTTLYNLGFGDIFVVKYDSSGNLLWAKSAGGPSDDTGADISSDAIGNVFISGFFWGPAISFGTTTLVNAGARDVFIVKYDAVGNVIWARSAGNIGDDICVGVSADSSGNVFITGYFDSATITFGTTTLTNAGDGDVFIVKYEPGGYVIWAKSAGGTSNDGGSSVYTDEGGNAYLTGGFMSPGITFGTTTLVNAGLANIFTVKYDAVGNVIWAKSAGGNTYDGGNDVAADASGNAFLIGIFQSPSIAFGTTTLFNNGFTDIYIVKYDPNGNVLWAKKAGGSDEDSGVGVALDANGFVYITGEFKSTSISFGTNILPNSGGSDFYIAKLDTFIITGLDEFTDQFEIIIAPNPFTSQTTISFKEEQKNSTIKIVDVVGKEIKSINFTGKKLILEKGEMPAGIYFVQVIDENNNRASRRILVQ